MNLFGALTGRVRRMSHVYRYSSYPVMRRESVAEHSWWVTFIAYVIGIDLLERGRIIELDVLCQRAIMHDLSEALSGDIIRSYKYSSEALLRELKHADVRNMDQLALDEFGDVVGDAILGGWHHAKAPDLVGDIVRFADMIAVFLYCRGERLAGNLAMDEVMKELYETWLYRFHDHPELGRYCDDLFPGKRFVDYHRHWELGSWVKSPYERAAKAMMRDHREGPVAAHKFEEAGDGAA